jgi:hypothetical protein
MVFSLMIFKTGVIQSGERHGYEKEIDQEKGSKEIRQ